MYELLHSRLIFGSVSNGLYMDLETIGENRFVRIYKKGIYINQLHMLLRIEEIDFFIRKDIKTDSQELFFITESLLRKSIIRMVPSGDKITIIRDYEGEATLTLNTVIFLRKFVPTMKIFFSAINTIVRPFNIIVIKDIVVCTFFHLLKHYMTNFKGIKPVIGEYSDKQIKNGSAAAADFIIRKHNDVCSFPSFKDQVFNIIKKTFLVDCKDHLKPKIMKKALSKDINVNLYALIYFFLE